MKCGKQIRIGEMGTSLLQEKIENLHNLADSILHIATTGGYVYADDLSVLNQKIHEQMNELYSQRGQTTEQEAALCLAMLMGYSVSMYANPNDETKRQNILIRSQKILDSLSISPLKKQLLAICKEYASV